MSLEESAVWIVVSLWIVLAIAELLWSAGSRSSSRWLRWRRHLGLALLNGIMLRIVAPGGAMAAAIWAAEQQQGLMHLLSLPIALQWVITLSVLDLAIYWQHRIFHLHPLWWLHAVHHSDTEFDLSTGVRFHPFEILLSMIWKMCVVVALGAPATAVVVYEIILVSMSLFTHADMRLPEWLDRRLRWLLVTPDMHRIHHSTKRHETDSNYGNALSVWDRLFRSSRAQAEPDYHIGLEEWREPGFQSLPRLLDQPFRD